MAKYILALDQGTTSSRAILFDHEQNIIGMAQKEFPQIYPVEGWVEHDPMEIYASQYAVMMELIAGKGIDAKDIAAIGITNQRETTIVWDRHTGVPVCNAIVWQCRRTSGMVDRLVAEGHGDYITRTTGLVPDAYFSGTKIRWILDHVDGARERAKKGELLFGTVDTWLVWKLTGGRVHITDYTNASRTMLFDIHKLDWDETLLSLMDVPREMLPEPRPSSEIYGFMNIQGAEIPVASAAGDQQAALFGQCCFEKGEAKNTYGTGCFLLMNTGNEPCESRNGLVSTVAAGTGKRGSPAEIRYALEGSVFSAGAVMQWLRDEMRIITGASEAGYYAEKVSGTGGVYIVPAFTGLGAPWWDQYARGTITGITRGTAREHIIRAAEESIAYQSLDVLRAMEKDTGHAIAELRVDGGATGDRFLMQFQADIMNGRIVRPLVRETTALGAAYLAGLATGFWRDTAELRALWKEEALFTPRMDAEERMRLIAGWHRAVERSLRQAEENQP